MALIKLLILQVTLFCQYSLFVLFPDFSILNTEELSIINITVLKYLILTVNFTANNVPVF